MTEDGAERGRQRTWGVLRALAALALAASSAAAVDQYAGSHAFCSPSGGCAAVRASSIGRALGDALPALGMLGFAIVLVTSLSRRPALRRAALAAALAGGAGALALIALQLLVIGRLCALCMTADLAALGAGAMALTQLRRPLPAAPADLARSAALAAGLLAALGPPAWALALPPEIPAYVRRELRPGRVVIVELSDFECPFCRAMHPALSLALAPHGDRVRVVRKSIPLPGHPHARGAAAAYRCAIEQQRGDAMADVLFRTEALAPADCIAHARALGLDVDRFARCMAARKTLAAIERETDEVWRAGLDGLPTVFVNQERIVGFDAQSGPARYAQAIDAALHGEGPKPRRWPLAVVLGLALSVLLPGLRARRSRRATQTQ